METPKFQAVAYEPAPCETCGGPLGILPTNRERQILALIASGLRNKEIGVELGITEHTVKNHLTQINRKTGRRDRTSSVMVGLREGWIKAVEG